MKIVKFDKFQLLLGDSSRSLFDYFQVEELHGLSLTECLNYPEPLKPGTEGVYIWGMANLSPIPDDLPYVFLNMHRMHGDYRDITTIMHETVHMGLLLYNYDLDKEEEIVSWAEHWANIIYSEHFINP
jgi:hypothetical protein